MPLQLKDLKIGQEITLVSKGIYHGYTDYIQQHNVGSTRFLLITKIGKIYIYGKSIYFDETTGKKELNWEEKINPSDYKIFLGIQMQFRTQKRQFDQKYENYEKLRNKKNFELDHKYNTLKHEELKQWELTNPYPTQTIDDYKLEGDN